MVTDMQIQQNIIVYVPIKEAELIRAKLLESEVLDMNRKIRKVTENGQKYLPACNKKNSRICMP
jgi:hypothetical protein